MIPKLLYIGNPGLTVQPVVQPLEGQRVVITSIRLSVPGNKNGTYEIHHVNRGQTATSTSNTLAYNVALTAKAAVEFLTHPIVINEGEGLWISSDEVVFAIYGILL